jgi:hypothetical protein
MDWEELEKKHVGPPIHPKPVKVSRTDSAFISYHMQLALRSEVSEGNNRVLSKNTVTE